MPVDQITVVLLPAAFTWQSDVITPHMYAYGVRLFNMEAKEHVTRETKGN